MPLAGAGKYQFLRKNYHPIHPFFIHKHPYPTQMNIFIYSIHPSLLQSSSLPPIPLLINHNFPWKSKVKHKSVGITWFYSKSSLTKYKKYLLEASYGTSETCELKHQLGVGEHLACIIMTRCVTRPLVIDSGRLETSEMLYLFSSTRQPSR